MMNSMISAGSAHHDASLGRGGVIEMRWTENRAVSWYRSINRSKDLVVVEVEDVLWR